MNPNPEPGPAAAPALSNSEGMLRAFVAISLPPEVQERIAEWQRAWRPAWPSHLVRWVRPAQIHLTLHFLGDLPAASLETLRARLHEAGRRSEPFRLRVDGLGCFPAPQRPRVLWIGLGGDLAALEALHRGVVSATGGEKSEGPRETFLPHLTVARLRHSGPTAARQVGEWLAAAPSCKTDDWPVRQFELMRSELSPAGPRYSCLAECPLGRSSADGTD